MTLIIKLQDRLRSGEDCADEAADRLDQLEALQREAAEERESHRDQRRRMEHAFGAYLHEQDQDLERVKELLTVDGQTDLARDITAAVASIEAALTARKAGFVRSDSFGYRED